MKLVDGGEETDSDTRSPSAPLQILVVQAQHAQALQAQAQVLQAHANAIDELQKEMIKRNESDARQQGEEPPTPPRATLLGTGNIRGVLRVCKHAAMLLRAMTHVPPLYHLQQRDGPSTPGGRARAPGRHIVCVCIAHIVCVCIAARVDDAVP